MCTTWRWRCWSWSAGTCRWWTPLGGWSAWCRSETCSAASCGWPDLARTWPGTGERMAGMKLIATYQYGDRFEVEVRGHRLVGDQGPTPTELFVASLAACVGFYAERFLRRHGLAAEDLRVEAHASMSADRPARIGEITLQLAGLPPMPAGRRAALHAVVEHCTVHN